MPANTLLSAVLVTGAGASRPIASAVEHRKTFQATVVGTGAVTATVLIQVSDNNTDWLTVGTITLSGTTSASDGFAHDAAWLNYRANCTAITGTSAALTVVMGR